jgi:hypothetical protein
MIRGCAMRRQIVRPLAALLIALASLGCSSVGRAIVPCPLTYADQEKEVLALVPKGTRREEVLRRLHAAGIEGSFGISQRVYYCDLWNRPGGQRWQMNIALLFDENGILYKTQVGDSQFTAERDTQKAGASAQEPASQQPAADSPYVPSPDR